MMEIPIISAGLGAILSSTLPRLYDAVGSKNDLAADVRYINQELVHIQGVIHQHLRNPKHMSDLQKAKVAEMRRLAYDIEDCVDRFLPPNGSKKIGHRQFAAKLSQIKEWVEGMRQRVKFYSDEESKSKPSSPATSAPAAPTSSATFENTLAGLSEVHAQQLLEVLKDQVEDVLALVKGSDSPSGRKLKVISIVGFGGMCMTVLAHQVYSHLHDQYPLRAFVNAAGKSKEQIVEEIREKLLNQEEELLKKQHKNVKGKGTANDTDGEPDGEVKTMCVANDTDGASTSSKTVSIIGHDEQPRHTSCPEENEQRYFIVIDDVCEEKLGRHVISEFSKDKNADIGIILTTTIVSVAERCRSGDGHVYKMRPLSDRESGNLFLNVACIKAGHSAPAREKELLEIRGKCDGVPLALVSLAKFCNGDLGRCKEAWRKLCSPEEEEDCDLARMQQVLGHSYASLSSLDLQACLLYFCMFPRGHPVRRGSLIRRWLAEGAELNCSTSASAVENFKRLIDRSIIWPIQVSINGDAKTCHPPGMMLEYITGMSKLLNFIMLASDGTCKPQDIRRLSLHHTGVEDDERVLLQDLSRLRTLAVFRSTGEKADLSFERCELLRVLDLEACHGLDDSHMDEICKRLHLLKYLSLHESITQVPRDIGDLQCLETLDLGKKVVVTVPAEVIKLPGLRHLLGKFELLTNYYPIRSDSKSSGLKNFLSKKSNLETLAGFVTRKSIGFPQLMRHMSRLRKVKIRCTSDASLRNVEDLSASIQEFLGRAELTPVVPFSLSIDTEGCTVPLLDKLVAPSRKNKSSRWSCIGKVINHPGDSSSEQKDQAAVGPSEQNCDVGGLSSLKLRGELRRVPAFVRNLSLIKELCLSSSTTVIWNDIVDGLSNLRVLEHLKLVVVNIVGTIVGIQDSRVKRVVLIEPRKMESLQRICLLAKEMLPRIEIQDGALPSLISLHLICQPLQDLSGVQITHLKGLKEVALHCGVEPRTKDVWKEAARSHPNRPHVQFIESHDRPGPQ